MSECVRRDRLFAFSQPELLLQSLFLGVLRTNLDRQRLIEEFLEVFFFGCLTENHCLS